MEVRNKKHMTRQEHIVPESYLKNFCDDKDRLYVYEQNKEIRPSRPRNECRERDFYEYELAGRKTENACEDWLARIEDDARKVLPLISESQQLNKEQATTWACFVASLFARTRKVRAQFSSLMVQRFRAQTQDPEFIRNLQYELLQAGELRYADDLQREIDHLREAMEADDSFYHVTGLPRKTKVLAEAVLYKNWYTLCAPPGEFFITSDCPVVTVERIDNKWALGSGFGKENVLILLPLSPEKVFLAAPSHFKINPAVGPDFVDSTNVVVARFAHKNVYGHVKSEEIKILADLEINRVLFGQNAFLPMTPSAQ
jgi:hypothetical protein